MWTTAATVDGEGRPWTRILHPIWVWDGESLVGWIAPGRLRRRSPNLAAHPYVSLTYWDPTHDTANADCRATWANDDETRTWLRDTFKRAPAPFG